VFVRRAQNPASTLVLNVSPKQSEIGEKNSMKITGLAVILLAIGGAAFAQAPAATTAGQSGKPQVTTFMHQTLGESIEDFMRISGTKMCASHKPHSSEWCETFKKVEAGENGVVTDSNASTSVSLVFAEKKLVQVLVQGKADWAKSVAEFTQKYGAPDTQTASSAAWSFGDGGGISVSGQPDNSFTANFFSRDGKSKEDKPTTPASAKNAVAQEVAQSATSKTAGKEAAPTPVSGSPTAFKNFALGSSVDDFIRDGVINESFCVKPKGDMKKACKDLDRIKAGQNVGIEISHNQSGRVSLYFENRKLMQVTVDPSISSSFAENTLAITQKYGPPTTNEVNSYANALGGKWECGDAMWLRPDGAVISVHEFIMNVLGPTRVVTVTFKAKELVNKESAAHAARQMSY
jgi:hypothetical protein